MSFLEKESQGSFASAYNEIFDRFYLLQPSDRDRGFSPFELLFFFDGGICTFGEASLSQRLRLFRLLFLRPLLLPAGLPLSSLLLYQLCGSALGNNQLCSPRVPDARGCLPSFSPNLDDGVFLSLEIAAIPYLTDICGSGVVFVF